MTSPNDSPQTPSRTRAGWIMAGLLSAFLIYSGVMKLVNPPLVSQPWVEQFGYPAEITGIVGVVELVSVALYLVPRTAVLGAVLLTGYMGGAIATHVRINDWFIFPALLGVLAWLALYLRDPRIRSLLPFSTNS